MKNGLSIIIRNEEQFEKEMQLAKDKAKSSWKGRGISSNEALIIQMSQKIFEKQFESHCHDVLEYFF